MHNFFDNKFQKQTISIGPGEYHISGENIIIQTVLGSCVAVCLFTDFDKFCGMNHFMLPGNVEEKPNDQGYDYDSARYGMFSMEILINSLMKKGLSKNKLKAKVFGGGKVIDFKTIKSSIGDNNIKFILNYLEKENIPIISSHLGGDFARKILFFAENKKVLLKEISKTEAFTTAKEEIEYEKVLDSEIKKTQSSVITFFD
jgi:chemotaxis protein CheD